MKIGNIRLSVDEDNIDKVIDDIQGDIDDSVASAIGQTALDGRNRAQYEIKTKDRIWNRDVLNNWVPIREKTEFGVHVTGYQNYSDHAGVVDDGASFSTPPNVDNLYEYVVSEYNHSTENEAKNHAYNLSQRLFETGLTGIDFTGKAEDLMLENIEHNIRREL